MILFFPFVFFTVIYNFFTGNPAPIIGWTIKTSRQILNNEKVIRLKNGDKHKLSHEKVPNKVILKYEDWNNDRPYLDSGIEGMYTVNENSKYRDLLILNLTTSKIEQKEIRFHQVGYPHFDFYVYGADYQSALIDNKYRIILSYIDYSQSMPILYDDKIHLFKDKDNNQ